MIAFFIFDNNNGLCYYLEVLTIIDSNNMSKTLTDDLISLIFNTGQVLREKARSNDHLNDCSFVHLRTLLYIKEQKEISMRDLAHFLHITPPSTTSLINSLVRKGFVKRTSSKDDRRSITLQITNSGLELLKNNLKRAASIIEVALNKLSKKEKMLFISILKKIS